MNAKKKGGIILGGVPRMNLLPPSHFEKIKTAQTISSVLVWIILAVLIAMAGIAMMWFYQNQRADELARVQADNATLQAERDNFPEVIEIRTALGNIVNVQNAIPDHLDYARVISEVQETLPEDASIETLALVPYPIVDGTLIMVNTEFESAAFVDSAEFVQALENIPGFERFEFRTSELRTEPYLHTLVLFFNGDEYSLEDGGAQ